MSDPKYYKMSQFGSLGSLDHGLVELTWRKRPHERSREAFFQSFRDKGAVWIAQELAEESDAFFFDGARALKLLREADPRRRLKVLELLRARAGSSRGETSLDTLERRLGEERAELRRFLEEAERTREQRDAALSPHHAVYHYTALAPVHVDAYRLRRGELREAVKQALSHAGLAVVDRTTRQGVLLSWQGAEPSKNGIDQLYSLRGEDPFVRTYAEKRRPVCRYTLRLPQDEAQQVHAAAQGLVLEWEEAPPASRWELSAYLGRMCGDNVADALEASWSYLFQAYAEYLEDDLLGDATSYFGARIVDKVASPLGAFVIGNFLDTPEGGIDLPVLSLEIPRRVERRYHDYLEATGGRGFVTERYESDA